MMPGDGRPAWALTISVLLHAGIGAAILSVMAMPAPVPPAVMPQIELLQTLPVPPAQQQARPSPTDLPVKAKPAPVAPKQAPVPPPAPPPPVIQGASSSTPVPPPPKPVSRPAKSQHVQPIRHQQPAKKTVEAAAAPSSGEETKKQTVLAEAPAPTPPAGPPPDYIGAIAQRLQQVKEYPAEARSRGDEGTVLLLIDLGPDGRVLAARIEESAKVPALDREAMAMVARAAPFPPFPPTFKRDTLELLVPVAFSLKHG